MITELNTKCPSFVATEEINKHKTNCHIDVKKQTCPKLQFMDKLNLKSSVTNQKENVKPKMRKHKPVCYGTGLLPCPDLGTGWLFQQIVRRHGKSAGGYDVYYYSPDRQIFRSKLQLQNHFTDKLSLVHFDFNAGRFLKKGEEALRKKDALLTNELKWYRVSRGKVKDSVNQYQYGIIPVPISARIPRRQSKQQKAFLRKIKAKNDRKVISKIRIRRKKVYGFEAFSADVYKKCASVSTGCYPMRKVIDRAWELLDSWKKSWYYNNPVVEVESVAQPDRIGNLKTRVITGKRASRCGKCKGCCRTNCGLCSNCRDMPKFGGNGKRKQSCKLRKCLNPALHSEERTETSNVASKKRKFRTPELSLCPVSSLPSTVLPETPTPEDGVSSARITEIENFQDLSQDAFPAMICADGSAESVQASTATGLELETPTCSSLSDLLACIPPSTSDSPDATSLASRHLNGSTPNVATPVVSQPNDSNIFSTLSNCFDSPSSPLGQSPTQQPPPSHPLPLLPPSPDKQPSHVTTRNDVTPVSSDTQLCLFQSAPTKPCHQQTVSTHTSPCATSPVPDSTINAVEMVSSTAEACGEDATAGVAGNVQSSESFETPLTVALTKATFSVTDATAPDATVSAPLVAVSASHEPVSAPDSTVTSTDTTVPATSAFFSAEDTTIPLPEATVSGREAAATISAGIPVSSDLKPFVNPQKVFGRGSDKEPFKDCSYFPFAPVTDSFKREISVPERILPKLATPGNLGTNSVRNLPLVPCLTSNTATDSNSSTPVSFWRQLVQPHTLAPYKTGTNPLNNRQPFLMLPPHNRPYPPAAGNST